MNKNSLFLFVHGIISKPLIVNATRFLEALQAKALPKFVEKTVSLFGMSLFIASLNSGSNGNCYYVGNKEEAVLIDAGISCRETETRMQRLRLSMQTVKAIFISHEHTDHIQGLAALAKKHKLPVYITESTLRGCGGMNNDCCTHPFTVCQPVQVGSLLVTAFSKLHDAADPHSFVVSGNEVTVGVFTDIGSPCAQVIHHFRLCHAAFLETNYDEVMLEQGSYPVHLKRRISGRHGHLSNRQALDLFVKNKPPFMSHLLLSHLSKENNHPKLVEDLFRAQAGDTQVVVASRYKETEVYEVRKTIASAFTGRKYPVAVRAITASQLSLF